MDLYNKNKTEKKKTIVTISLILSRQFNKKLVITGVVKPKNSMYIKILLNFVLKENAWAPTLIIRHVHTCFWKLLSTPLPLYNSQTLSTDFSFVMMWDVGMWIGKQPKYKTTIILLPYSDIDMSKRTEPTGIGPTREPTSSIIKNRTGLPVLSVPVSIFAGSLILPFWRIIQILVSLFECNYVHVWLDQQLAKSQLKDYKSYWILNVKRCEYLKAISTKWKSEYLQCNDLLIKRHNKLI